MTSCCDAAAGKNPHLIFFYMAVAIPQSNNEADNQYGPVRGVDRLRNSRLVTSDLRKRKKGRGGVSTRE